MPVLQHVSLHRSLSFLFSACREQSKSYKDDFALESVGYDGYAEQEVIPAARLRVAKHPL